MTKNDGVVSVVSMLFPVATVMHLNQHLFALSKSETYFQVVVKKCIY